MVYGWGSERFPRYYAFYEMKGVGHAPGGPPGVPRSMSLNVSYYKEQEYIWFREGVLNPKLLCIFTFFHTNAYATKFDLGLK